jgi:adenylate kinase family enzyme
MQISKVLGSSPLRIHITGASGSGTTTLGAALASEFGISHLDADDYFWLPSDPPYSQKRQSSERLSSIVSDLMFGQNVVLSGSKVGWGKP